MRDWLRERVRRRAPTAGLLAAAVSILVPVFPAAAEAEAAFAFERIVSRGHPVAEVPYGIILQQSFDAELACALRRDLSLQDERPLAGSLDAPLRLDVSTVRCPAGVPDDGLTRCSWRIAGSLQSGDAAWRGEAGRIRISMPPAIGVYELQLACWPGDNPERGDVMARTLYVTRSAPLHIVRPPRAEWYRRACLATAGMSRQAPEHEVLSSLLEGLYAYGRNRWRYGTFAERQNPRLDRLQRFAGMRCAGNWCSCPGGVLLDDESVCDFGSCYQFSDAFDLAAATLGLGGLQPVAIYGENGMGLVTRAGARSVDSDFGGNVDCRDQEPCFSYLFGSHSLRLRDGRYYDATFNDLQEDRTRPIGRNLMSWDAEQRGFRLDGPPGLLCLAPHRLPYGGWSFFEYPDPGAGGPACPEQGPSGGTSLRPLLPAVAKVDFTPFDFNDDGLYERLRALVTLTFARRAQISLLGLLFSGTLESPELLAVSSASDSSLLPVTTVSGDVGSVLVDLYFSGEAIYQSGTDGPYLLAVTAFDEQLGSSHYGFYASPRLDHRDFGEVEARIEELGIEPVDLDDDGFYDRLRVKVPVQVRSPMVVAMEMRLAKEGKTIGYRGKIAALLEQQADILQDLVIDFPGADIAAAGIDGPYSVTIELFGKRQGLPYRVDARETATEAYEASAFSPEGHLPPPPDFLLSLGR